MMRVLTPNGNVIEVEKAEAIVEKRVSFNGRDIRLCQTAKDKSQPASGLYFSVKTESVFTIANEGNLLVGNLPVDTVKKIVTNLAKDGFCDLSGFDYQPEIGINDKPVFDEGKSHPYFCRSNVAMMFAPRQNMDFRRTILRKQIFLMMICGLMTTLIMIAVMMALIMENKIKNA